MKEEPDAKTGPLRDVACPRLAALLSDGTGGARGFERGVVVVGAGWIPFSHPRFWASSVWPIFGSACRLGRWRPCGCSSSVGPSMASAGSAGGLGRVGPGGATGVSDHTQTPLADPAVGFGCYRYWPTFPLCAAGAVVQGLGRLGLGLCAASVAAGTRLDPAPAITSPPGRAQSNLVEHTPVEGTKPTLNTGTIRLGFDTVVHTSDGSLTVRFSPLSISLERATCPHS